MALIKCPGCGKDVSDKAKSCPKCGYLPGNRRGLSGETLKSSGSIKKTIADFFTADVVDPFKKDFSQIRNHKGCLGCLVLIGVFLIIALVSTLFESGDKTEKQSTSQSQATITLNASVSFTGTEFIIVNNDDFDWTNVTLRVNSGLVWGGFDFKTPRINAGGKYAVGAMQFVKSDGTRFNPFKTKPQNFSIWSDTPRGEGIYYLGLPIGWK